MRELKTRSGDVYNLDLSMIASINLETNIQQESMDEIPYPSPQPFYTITNE